jgi:hypothetical protein
LNDPALPPVDCGCRPLRQFHYPTENSIIRPNVRARQEKALQADGADVRSAFLLSARRERPAAAQARQTNPPGRRLFLSFQILPKFPGLPTFTGLSMSPIFFVPPHDDRNGTSVRVLSRRQHDKQQSDGIANDAPTPIDPV